tara:strand:- start:898 stop:1866 length:969 start_codon:yes stop_codon:yes gene_type:complete
MLKKLDLLVNNLRTCKYNSYANNQKSILVLKAYNCRRDFISAFKSLLKKSNDLPNLSSTPVRTPIYTKKVIKNINNLELKPAEIPLKIHTDINVAKQIIKKRGYINRIFNTMADTNTLYILKVDKNSRDPYSEVFLKAVDNCICVGSTRYNGDYYKKIKYASIAYFNKNNYYKLFNYNSKNFKKSTLDDVFANNESLELNMLVVYANVLNCNLVYIKADSEPQFMTPYVRHNVTVVLYEEFNSLFCLKTHNKQTFIRGTQLIKPLDIDRIFKKSKLETKKLPELQNLTRMKNMEYKKMGKNRKINMTKDELVSQLLSNSTYN